MNKLRLFLSNVIGILLFIVFVLGPICVLAIGLAKADTKTVNDAMSLMTSSIIMNSMM